MPVSAHAKGHAPPKNSGVLAFLAFDWVQCSGVLWHDPACTETGEDDSSNPERAEVTSASLTPMQGVVVTSLEAHQQQAEQRVPIYACRGPDFTSVGWAYLRPEPFNRLGIKD